MLVSPMSSSSTSSFSSTRTRLVLVKSDRPPTGALLSPTARSTCARIVSLPPLPTAIISSRSWIAKRSRSLSASMYTRYVHVPVSAPLTPEPSPSPPPPPLPPLPPFAAEPPVPLPPLELVGLPASPLSSPPWFEVPPLEGAPPSPGCAPAPVSPASGCVGRSLVPPVASSSPSSLTTQPANPPLVSTTESKRLAAVSAPRVRFHQPTELSKASAPVASRSPNQPRSRSLLLTERLPLPQAPAFSRQRRAWDR